MKSEQLQIRLSLAQKNALKRLARAASQDVSQYVLSRALPDQAIQFASLVERLARSTDARFELAELNDFLSGLDPASLSQLPGDVMHRLGPVLQCRVAAMVEQACSQRDQPPPPWTGDIPPLESPDMAAPLRSLRLHLLKASPVAFRRRNLFVDSTIGDRR